MKKAVGLQTRGSFRLLYEMDSLSLAIYTTLSPAGMMAFVFMTIMSLADAASEKRTIHDYLFAIPFFLVLSGFITSTAHLGTPANALYVVTGTGRSPLSNEVIAVLVFLFLAGSYWMISVSRPLSPRVTKLWLSAASLAAVVALGFTAIAYSIRTIPTWDTCYTPLALIVGAVGLGALLAGGTYHLAGSHSKDWGIALFTLYALSCLGVLGLMALLREEMASISSFTMQAINLAPNYVETLGFYAIACIASVWLAFAVLLREGLMKRFRFTLVITSIVIALLGAFLVRVLFYQIYMTIGL